MEKVVLQAEPRTPGRHENRELREGQRVPAVIYGKDTEAQSVSLDRKQLGMALHRSGGGVIEVEVPGQAQLHVLAREVQRHPVKHNVQHVDFYAVSMTQLVRLQVPVVAEGIAPIMADANNVLVRQADMIEIECLPGDIPEHFVADLSTLVTLDDEVLVKQLRVPETVKVLTPGDHVLFSVTASRAAVGEEAEATPEAPSADEVEVIRKRKTEEEE
jgi:large subunit ribosomal protein L25